MAEKRTHKRRNGKDTSAAKEKKQPRWASIDVQIAFGIFLLFLALYLSIFFSFCENVYLFYVHRF